MSGFIRERYLMPGYTAGSTTSPIQLADFTTFNPKTSQHFAQTHVFRGTTPEQRPYGELFIVVQIDHATKSSPHISEAIATILQYEYYRGSPSDPVKNLEDALHKTNEILSDLAARGEIHWIGKLHAVVAVFQRDGIHLSASGRGKAFLIRQDEIAEISTGLYDASKAASPMKTFEHLASGELKDGDSVLITTPGVTDYATPQLLRQLISNVSPAVAISSLQERVARDPSKAHAVIVLNYNREHVKAAAVPVATPIPHATIRPSFKATAAPAKLTSSVVSPTAPTGSVAKKSPLALLQPAGVWFKKLRMPRFGRGRTKTTATTSAAAQTSDPTGTQTGIKKISKNKFVAAVAMAYRRLPLRVKLFGGLALLLVIIFVISIFAFTGARQSSADREALVGKLNQAKQFEQDAAAALIFKDRTQAQNLLAQAEGLLAEIPADKALAPEIEALKSAIAQDYEKLSGSVKIAEPTVLATLPDPGQAVGLALIEGQLVAWLSNGDLVTVSIDDGQLATGETIARDLGEPTVGALDEQRLLLWTDEDQLVSLEDGSLDELEVSGSFSPQLVSAMETYGNRLYVLDPAKNRLTRHSKTIAGYSQGEEWILDDTSVAEAIDLAIDGNVWLLQKNGQVTKMLSGIKEDFTLGPVVDPLESATKIMTSENAVYLFILEPTKKRLLQFEKETGQFVKQYTSDAFGELRDMSVIEKGNKAYLLSGNTIYQIDLES